MPIRKRTWAQAKAKARAESVRIVGKCRYCEKQVLTDVPFVCFADKSCAHYDCMKKDDMKIFNPTLHERWSLIFPTLQFSFSSYKYSSPSYSQTRFCINPPV